MLLFLGSLAGAVIAAVLVEKGIDYLIILWRKYKK